MKWLPDDLSREQTLWLLPNALIAGFVAAGVAHIAIEQIRDSRHYADPRLILAAVGNTAAMLAAVLVMILCARRMRQRFAVQYMRFSILPLVFAEAVALVLTGFILDCGETGSRLLMIALPLNLALIAFQHRIPGRPPYFARHSGAG